MGKHISGGFQKKASDMPSFGATFFVTGANLRRSSKPTSPEAAPEVEEEASPPSPSTPASAPKEQ